MKRKCNPLLDLLIVREQMQIIASLQNQYGSNEQVEEKRKQIKELLFSIRPVLQQITAICQEIKEIYVNDTKGEKHE